MQLMIYANCLACDPMINTRDEFSNMLPPPNTNPFIKSVFGPKVNIFPKLKMTGP